MIRRLRLFFMAAMGRGYPTVVFIEAGEDPTKNRLPMIAPLNITMILTVIVMVAATPFLALGFYKVYFPPQPTPTPTITITPEGTMESTAEATLEPTQTSTPEPVIIVITATPTATDMPTATWTPSLTPTLTPTSTPVALWPLEMTATQLKESLLLTQASTPGRLPHYIVVTPTPIR